MKPIRYKKTIPLAIRDEKVVQMIQKGHQVHRSKREKQRSRAGRYAERCRKERNEYK